MAAKATANIGSTSLSQEGALIGSALRPERATMTGVR